MSRSRKVILIFIGCVVVAAPVLALIPRATATKGPRMVSLSNGRQLATGCKLYAIDHEGRLPSHLSDLQPDYTADFDALRYISVRHEGDLPIKMDWLYFGAGFEEDRPPAILIASPVTVTGSRFLFWREHYRLVVSVDGKPRFVKESEYQRLLSGTSK